MKGGQPMADDRAAAEIEQFLAERADRLMRTAVLHTGSQDAGQDLLQAALERIVARWQRLDGDPEAYLRRTLFNLAVDGFRRNGRLQRKLLLIRPLIEATVDPTVEVDLRDALVRLMRQLPPNQRAVLVLRYWEQLTEAEAAVVLGWAEGTVKSATSRGLQRLRELAES
jgi:RNA polymerase sigma-70 factor (sigma-E family)